MQEETSTITWSAPEFRHYEKTSGWYITLAAVSVLIIAFFVFQNDIFAAVTIALLAIFIAFFSTQRPEIVTIELGPKALAVGTVSFPYKQLKHFWVVNNARHKTLNIETNTILNNTLVIELMDQNEDEIRNFLLRHLPEHHETTETFAQKISHKLKF